MIPDNLHDPHKSHLVTKSTAEHAHTGTMWHQTSAVTMANLAGGLAFWPDEIIDPGAKDLNSPGGLSCEFWSGCGHTFP